VRRKRNKAKKRYRVASWRQDNPSPRYRVASWRRYEAPELRNKEAPWPWPPRRKRRTPREGAPRGEGVEVQNGDRDEDSSGF